MVSSALSCFIVNLENYFPKEVEKHWTTQWLEHGLPAVPDPRGKTFALWRQTLFSDIALRLKILGGPTLNVSGLECLLEENASDEFDELLIEELLSDFGADVLRLHTCSLFSRKHPTTFRDQQIEGTSRFLQRIWRIVSAVACDWNLNRNGKERLSAQPQTSDSAASISAPLTRLVQNVEQRLTQGKLHIIISAFIEFANSIKGEERLAHAEAEVLVCLLAPFVPHLAEELWSGLGHCESIFRGAWGATVKQAC